MNGKEEAIDNWQQVLAAARTCSWPSGLAMPGATAFANTAFVNTYGLPVFSVQGQQFQDTESLPLRARFSDALRSWKQDTQYESSLRRIVLHPGYQAIIGIGKAALPFILEELQRNGGHWFWALHAITQEDPAREGDSFEATAQAWLRWGQAHGYVHPAARPRSALS
jgi:hypothetical protein